MKRFFLNNFLTNKNHKTEILLNGKKFIDKCLNNKDIIKIKIIDVKPRISVIIPVYNSEKTIYSAICSVQNQLYTDFEIILVDDYSSDNSSKIIQSLQKMDERIKIIRNQKNMGTLYSRNIGVLQSKGKYILALDNDDLFFSDDIFNFIFKIAQESDFDIVGFRAVRISNYEDNIEKIYDLYNYDGYPKNIIVYQPRLSTWMINIKGHFQPHDVTIWAKCFKSKVYKESIYRLGAKRYSIFVSWAEDTIMNYIIFNTAESFTFIHKYGIIHLHNSSTASFSLVEDIRLFGEIFLLDIIFDFSKNNIAKNYAVLGAFYVKRKHKINKFVNSTNLIYFKSVLNKFLIDPLITIYNKYKIKKEFNFFFN